MILNHCHEQFNLKMRCSRALTVLWSHCVIKNVYSELISSEFSVPDQQITLSSAASILFDYLNSDYLISMCPNSEYPNSEYLMVKYVNFEYLNFECLYSKYPN